MIAREGGPLEETCATSGKFWRPGVCMVQAGELRDFWLSDTPVVHGAHRAGRIVGDGDAAAGWLERELDNELDRIEGGA